MNPILAETLSDHELPTTEGPGVRWSLIREAGLEYVPAREGEEGQRLHLPSFATRADDGTYLIVDELGVDKLVPFRFECRTIRVNADHGILYDTMQHGIDDGFGCLLDDGCLAVLRRTKWELLIISPRGKILDRYGLETFSKRTPRLLFWTPAGTFLIAFLDRAGQFDAIELDRQGRLVWFLPPRAHPIGVPASIELLPSNTLLVADPFRHVVLELDREGNVVWQFGEAGKPSRATNQLSSPGSIRSLPHGERLVADTRNHRLLVVGRDGTASPIQVDQGNLCDPTCAEGLANGHYLICDAGNRRVIEVDRQGEITWQYGQGLAKRRFLSYPRSVEVTSSGHYLVADTAHDRIVEIESERVHEQPFQGRPTLFWPRCVRALPGGALLIADGRNCRIVEVSQEGCVSRELREVRLGGAMPLQDPHDVWRLANGHLLVSDSPRNLVLEVDWSGRVHRVIGDGQNVELDDPHSAQQLDDGRVVIADTGNHRVLIVDQDGNCVQDIRALSSGSSWLRLRRPRYAEVIRDGTMVIVDTDHNRVLAATLDGACIWELSHVPGSPLPRLRQPRWAKLIHRYEVVICDHFHHRIVHLKGSQAAKASPADQ